MAKLKDLIKENFSLVGGVVSTPNINRDGSSLSAIVEDQYGESHCLVIDNNKIEIKIPEYKVEDDWKEQADIIEKNKPAAKSKQMSIAGGLSYVPFKQKRKQEILNKQPQNKQRKINKLLDLNIEGKLSDVQLEVQLEKLVLSADEVLYVMDEADWANDNYGYGYGGYYGRY